MESNMAVDVTMLCHAACPTCAAHDIAAPGRLSTRFEVQSLVNALWYKLHGEVAFSGQGAEQLPGLYALFNVNATSTKISGKTTTARVAPVSGHTSALAWSLLSVIHAVSSLRERLQYDSLRPACHRYWPGALYRARADAELLSDGDVGAPSHQRRFQLRSVGVSAPADQYGYWLGLSATLVAASGLSTAASVQSVRPGQLLLLRHLST